MSRVETVFVQRVSSTCHIRKRVKAYVCSGLYHCIRWLDGKIVGINSRSDALELFIVVAGVWCLFACLCFGGHVSSIIPLTLADVNRCVEVFKIPLSEQGRVVYNESKFLITTHHKS